MCRHTFNRRWNKNRRHIVSTIPSCLIMPCETNRSSHFRSSHPEVFLGKGVLKICSKVTGEHLCQSTISIKLLCNFIKIELRHGCSSVNLLHNFRTPFLKSTYEGLLLLITNNRHVHKRTHVANIWSSRFLPRPNAFRQIASMGLDIWRIQ